MENETNAQFRTLIVSALGLSLTVWDIAFNLGVHNTIFYSKLMTLWVASTVVLLCVIIVGDSVHTLSRTGIVALLTPTVWFVLNALTPKVSVTWFEEFLWVIALIIFAIAIPYILFILFELIESDFFSMTPYSRNRLIGIVLFVALMGYGIGRFHPYFVSCEQFTIAGDQPPANCANWNLDE